MESGEEENPLFFSDTSDDDLSVESDEETEKNLIFKYFNLGLSYNEILCHLALKHDIVISYSTLRRRLESLNLGRRKNYVDLDNFVEYAIKAMDSSSNLHGYRWHHLKCIQEGMNVPRSLVYGTLQVVDPEGIESRKKGKLKRRVYVNNGPSWTWHADGYDKLKKYGICVSGCIDGFSRYLIWLKAGTTNNDPAVVGGYYITAVKELGGVPLTLRTDKGTENVRMEIFQELLRGENCNSSRPAYIKSRSTGNQRIEAFWAILRKENSQYWMDFFSEIDNDGHFDGSFLDKNLIRFFFLPIVQKELDSIRNVWNCHHIRKSKNAVALGGRPINLFEIPEIYENVENYLVKVEQEEVDVCKNYCVFERLTCDPDIYRLINIVMEEKSLSISKDEKVAKKQYISVRTEIKKLVESDSESESESESDS